MALRGCGASAQWAQLMPWRSSVGAGAACGVARSLLRLAAQPGCSDLGAVNLAAIGDTRPAAPTSRTGLRLAPHVVGCHSFPGGSRLRLGPPLRSALPCALLNCTTSNAAHTCNIPRDLNPHVYAHTQREGKGRPCFTVGITVSLWATRGCILFGHRPVACTSSRVLGCNSCCLHRPRLHIVQRALPCCRAWRRRHPPEGHSRCQPGQRGTRHE